MESGENLVLLALEAAVSQDPSLLQSATEKLQGWENDPQFYGILANVFASYTQNHDVRLLALTYVKNGVETKWRKFAPNRISPECKELIKKVLLEGLAEPSDQMIRQMAELIAKITRAEGPTDWPEILPRLVDNTQHGSGLLQERSLFFLYHILKTKASKRLTDDIDTFRVITSKLFVFLMQLWKTLHSNFLERLQSPTLQFGEEVPAACKVAQHARTCLKVLKTMTLYGVSRLHAVFEPLTFVLESFEHVKIMSEIRLKVIENPALVEVIEKTVSTHMKMLLSLLGSHPISFAEVINSAFEMLWQCLFTDKGISCQFDKFALQLMTLLRMIVNCDDYKVSTVKTMPTVPPPPQLVDVLEAKSKFFTCDRLVVMCRKLVSHYLILTGEEVVLWQDDPEEFMKLESDANYSVDFKECVRVLLLVILTNYRLTVAPIIVEMIQAVQNTDQNADDKALLLKEAVYKSAGYGAHDLYDVVDFDTWYRTHLIHELKIADPRYQLVRVRVVQLVDDWIGIKMSADYRPSLYQTYIHLLNPTQPILLRLVVANALRTTVDHLDFEKTVFGPFLPDMIKGLQETLSSVSSSWAKMKIIYVIAMIVERVEEEVCPYVKSLVDQLPLLWRDGSSENIVQDAIVDMLARLVTSLGALSVELHSFVLPIIHLATDVSQGFHVYIGDSGLELWQAIMTNTTVLPSEMMQLFGNMVGVLGLATPTEDSGTSLHGLLDIGTENLSKCFEIIHSYVVIGGIEFLQHYSSIVVEACRSYMNDVKPEGLKEIMSVVLRVLSILPDQGAQLMKPCISIVLGKVINKEEQKYSRVVSVFYMVLARLVFQNFPFFVQLLQEVATVHGTNMVDLFAALIDAWEEHLDVMIELEHRKMTGLAMASLLTIQDQIVAKHFATILVMCVEALHDAVNVNESDQSIYDVVHHKLTVNDKRIGEERLSPEELRLHRLDQQDPLYMSHYHKYLVSQLQATLQSHGEKAYFQLMGSVDPTILEQLSEFVPLSLLVPLGSQGNSPNIQ